MYRLHYRPQQLTIDSFLSPHFFYINVAWRVCCFEVLFTFSNVRNLLQIDLLLVYDCDVLQTLSTCGYVCIAAVFVFQAHKDSMQLSKQDRRAEQMMKKVTRDVQRLKRNSPHSNTQSFRYATKCKRFLTRLYVFNSVLWGRGSWSRFITNTIIIYCREKMAFFTNVSMTVPVIPQETPGNQSEEARLEEFLKDDRVGQEVWNDFNILTITNRRMLSFQKTWQAVIKSFHMFLQETWIPIEQRMLVEFGAKPQDLS